MRLLVVEDELRMATLLQRGLQEDGYAVDSRDFTDPGPAAGRRAVGSVTAGGVVSLHLGHPGTLEALPGILDDLAGRGLRPVTASALFA